MSFDHLREDMELERAVTEAFPAEKVNKQRGVFLAAVEKEALSRQRWQFPRLALPVAGAAVATAIALGVWWSAPDTPDAPPLTCTRSDGIPLEENGWVVAHTTPVVDLAFSDNSQVKIYKQSRVRLSRMSRAVVRLAIETGKIRSQIRQTGTTWLFEAGPYTAHVLGTIFDLSWQPDHKRLVVEMARGSVRVTGAQIEPPGIVVRENQRLEADLTQGTVELTDPNAITPDAGVDPDAAAFSDEREAEVKIPRQRAAPWKRLARSARYAQAWRRMNQTGIARLLQQEDSEGLLLIADTARFVGRPTVAQRALLRLRQRFPQTDRSALAAFHLGRLFWERGADDTQAAHWYRTFLRARPSHVLARDALGRLMLCLERLDARKKARRAARTYLDRYPDGDYADSARRILGTP